MLVWYLQEIPTGPTGTSSQSEQQQRSGPQEGGRSRTRRDFPFSVKIHSGIEPDPSLQPRGLKYWLCELFLALGGIPHRQLWSVSVGRGVAVLSVSYDSCRRPEEPRRYRCVPRCIARQRARVVPRSRHVRAAPLRDKFGGLERHVIHPCPGSSRSSQLPLWVKPGQAGAARAKRGKREVLLAAPVLWLLPSHAAGRVALSQLQTMSTFSVHRPAPACLCPWVP